MRIAYVVIHLGERLMNGGVGAKIRAQIRTWQESGNDTRLFLLTPDEIQSPQAMIYRFSPTGGFPLPKFLTKEIARSHQLGKLIEAVRKYEPDVIYLRYGLYAFPLQKLFRIAPVILELNTNDVEEYRFRGRFFYWLNRMTRGVLLGCSKGWVTASREISTLPENQRFHKPQCVIANGIEFKSVVPLPAPVNARPVVSLVGSPGMDWHGVDKLVRFATQNPDIDFHVIGLSKQDVSLEVPSNMEMHGFLPREKVQEILAHSDVACGTLALHRKGMQEASPLKVREALAFGIPVLIAYQDTDLYNLNMDTILCLPNVEDNLMEHQHEIREFIYRMMGRRVDRNLISVRLDQFTKEQARLAFFQKVIDSYKKRIRHPHQTMEPFSILFLGTQMAGGGAQKVLLDQADWFHAHGHKVTAAFFYDRDGLSQKWQCAHDFPILELKAFQPGAGMVRNAFSLLKGLLALWRLIRREKFDAIETFTHDSNLLGLPVAWLGGIPVRVATHHGTLGSWGDWRKQLHAWLVNHNIANVLVTVSEMTRQKAIEEGVLPDRISVIPNGIAPFSSEDVNGLEVRRRFGIGEDDLFLLSVGRLVYEKAHEILIAAIPAVLREFPNAKVGICGDGYMRSRLQAQIESLGLADSIKLLGQFDNVARFLASADVFIMSSRSEGLPIALLEAMSAGLPVIATRVEGMEEVIQDGENGLLVPTEDPGALSDGILRLLHDPAARSHMGMAARRCTKTSYTLDRMCEQYLEIFRQPRSERNP